MSVTTTIHVSGMTCGHCVSAVSQELSQVDGVTGVAVALDEGQVTVTSDGPVDHEALVAAVDEAGYEVLG